MRFLTLCTLAFLFCNSNNLEAQTIRKVLFLGNSYTASNNLPQMIKDAALSAGDTLVYDAHTPGGYQLIDHVSNSTSQNKIALGGWDYVILQGQSQEPIVQSTQFNSGGYQLNNQILQHNYCAVSMLYMTWGRKNGDPSNCPSYPVMCTYSGMDSTLKIKYLNLASTINAEVSPVSVVWNYLRQNHPNINLYQADGSHPSIEGTYAAACCFYTSIFKKNPLLITYNGSLSPSTASTIRNAVKTQVYDSISTWDYKKQATADFQYHIGSGNNQVVFNAINRGTIQDYHWDFGDGDTSISTNPIHSYASNGTYPVRLTTKNCDLQGLHTSTLDTTIQFCSHTPTVTTTNPWVCKHDTLWTQPANQYQWFAGYSLTQDTTQYLTDYQRFSSSTFSVMTQVNGCTELSQPFAANPQPSGYYFDAARGGDPCLGDTAIFAVLYTGGSIPTSAKIFWYKNDTLLSHATGSDTLLITSQGKYYSKVVDTNSNCPLDTTVSPFITFDCSSTGLNSFNVTEDMKVFPNPASDFIILTISADLKKVEPTLFIYDLNGRLKESMVLEKTTQVNISNLSSGIYFLKINSNDVSKVVKLIKE